MNGRKLKLDWNIFLLRCNKIWLQDTNDNLEDDLQKRKRYISSLSKEIYRMLITKPFVVNKPTGIDFIQQQLQTQFRDYLKAKRRTRARGTAADATNAADASGQLRICDF